MASDHSKTELLADLKQDEINSREAGEGKGTQEHIAGAQGKLASALSQARGDSDINDGGRKIAQEVEPRGGPVDRDAVEESLRTIAEEKISGHEMHLEKGSEAVRLQSAAEQYELAREGKDAQEESHLDKQ